MPTEDEVRVLKLLSAIEIPPTAAQTIQSWGTDAVTVVCEAALGTYPGLRPKVRNNAVALLGWMNHPQAMETVLMLLTDSSTDVSIRAMRAAGRQKNETAIDKMAQLLRMREAPPLLVAEALNALISIGTDRSMASVVTYRTANPADLPHRASRVVESIFAAEKKP